MVSDEDCGTVAREYGVSTTSAIPTAVDADYFTSHESEMLGNHLVFTGPMDWLPNEDGPIWLTQRVMPIIRRELPGRCPIRS